MVVIRLARGGRVKQAVYRIVAADKKRSATSKFLAILGTYSPHTKQVKLDKEAIESYLQSGAQPSDRVLRILQAEGVKTPGWAKTHDRFKKSKKIEEEAQDDNKEAVATEGAPGDSDTKQDVSTSESATPNETTVKDQKEATEKTAESTEETKEAK